MTDTLTRQNLALQRVMSTGEGRMALRQILGRGGLFRQPFVPGDAEATAFNCGMLNGALALYNDMLTASPTLATATLCEVDEEEPDQDE